jgi:hypothetical protein
MKHGWVVLGTFLMVLGLQRPVASEEWFDAYDHGLKALEHHDGTRAAADFERAIKRRSMPGEYVLTYGTNVLPEYHPYLRLAEAELLAGHPETAREALVRSEQRGRESSAERERLQARVEAALARRKGNTAAEDADLTELVRSIATRLADIELRLEKLEAEGTPAAAGVRK